MDECVEALSTIIYNKGKVSIWEPCGNDAYSIGQSSLNGERCWTPPSSLFQQPECQRAGNQGIPAAVAGLSKGKIHAVPLSFVPLIPACLFWTWHPTLKGYDLVLSKNALTYCSYSLKFTHSENSLNLNTEQNKGCLFLFPFGVTIDTEIAMPTAGKFT